MSIFGKIFKKKEPAAPTTQEATHKLRDVEDMLLKKQAHLEDKMNEALATAKKHGTANKRLALQALKRKKMYEKEYDQISGTLQTIGHQRESLENASLNAETFKVMGQASKALGKLNKDMDADRAHDLMDEIAEQIELGDEVAQALSNSSAFGVQYDEDELMAELEELEDEDLESELLNINPVPAASLSDRLPDIPRSEPESVKKRPAKKKDEDDLAELEAWATA